MKQQPKFTPHDAIFSAEPRFDELPAEHARRKRRRRTVWLAIVLGAVLLLLVIGLYVYSGYTGIKATIDATMTAFVVTQRARP